MSWFHVTQRRTKDNRPKIYGEQCSKPTKKLCELACAVVSSSHLELRVYRGHRTAPSHDVFVMACLPGKLIDLVTWTLDLYIHTSKTVPPTFWTNLSTHTLDECTIHHINRHTNSFFKVF